MGQQGLGPYRHVQALPAYSDLHLLALIESWLALGLTLQQQQQQEQMRQGQSIQLPATSRPLDSGCLQQWHQWQRRVFQQAVSWVAPFQCLLHLTASPAPATGCHHNSQQRSSTRHHTTGTTLASSIQLFLQACQPMQASGSQCSVLQCSCLGRQLLLPKWLTAPQLQACSAATAMA